MSIHNKNFLDHLGLRDLRKHARRDLRDIYCFYVDAETRQHIDQMGWFRRFVHRLYHLFKSLFKKLSPGRRILLILAAIFQFGNNSPGPGTATIDHRGFFLLLLILILELKDKLLAKDELRIGHSVQRALLPDSKPNIAGWDIYLMTQPANDVGGDLVDLVAHEGRTAAVLADVAGKGLGAALLSAKLQSTLRALFPHFKDPSRLCQEVNTILCRDGLPNRFISMIHVEFTSDSGGLCFINAGHFPPLFISGSTVQETVKGEPALGLTPLTEYRLHRLECKSGDRLLIYSDGLTEARNEQDEFWGQERLAYWLTEHSNLTAQEMVNGLLEELKLFCGDAPQSDDVSLLVLRRL
ncbi:serine/threonine-protein phosphatase [candidate division KSB1 bacterium]|nr:serine/threonine-protein phosphatase [candidate division KSB1 bacterium]